VGVPGPRTFFLIFRTGKNCALFFFFPPLSPELGGPLPPPRRVDGRSSGFPPPRCLHRSLFSPLFPLSGVAQTGSRVLSSAEPRSPLPSSFLFFSLAGCRGGLPCFLTLRLPALILFFFSRTWLAIPPFFSFSPSFVTQGLFFFFWCRSKLDRQFSFGSQSFPFSFPFPPCRGTFFSQANCNISHVLFPPVRTE